MLLEPGSWFVPRMSVNLWSSCPSLLSSWNCRPVPPSEAVVFWSNKIRIAIAYISSSNWKEWRNKMRRCMHSFVQQRFPVFVTGKFPFFAVPDIKSTAGKQGPDFFLLDLRLQWKRWAFNWHEKNQLYLRAYLSKWWLMKWITRKGSEQLLGSMGSESLSTRK